MVARPGPSGGPAVQSSFRAVFAILFAVTLAASSGTTAMQSLLPAIGRSTGVADNLVVTISSMSAFLGIFTMPFWGQTSDRLGAKPVVLIGVAGVALSMLATGAAVMAGMRHLYGPGLILLSLIASRALYGSVGLASNPAIQGYVGVKTSREERTNAMALLASANGIGAIIGPAVAPFLLFPVVSLGGPFFTLALVCAVLFVVVLLRVPSDGPAVREAAAGPRPRSLTVVSDRRLRPFVIYGVLLSVVAASAGQTLGFVVMDRMKLPPIQSQPWAGAAMMAGAMAVLIAQWGLIRMLRLTPRTLLVSGAAVAAVGQVLQGFAPSFPSIVFAFALANLGFGLARPGFTAGISLAAPREWQSMVAGVVTGIGGMGLIVGPIASMTLYQWSKPLPFLLNGALMASMVAYSLLSPALRGAAPEPPVTEEQVEQAEILEAR